jgi:8-oxo-dGTP pyrophosphatase MutT (NUDIX family)
MIVTCGIYLYSTLQKQFLLCHATNSRFDIWSIPKGLPDENESCFDAASRELYEETGIELSKISVLKMQELPSVDYTKQKKILHPFLVITDTDLSTFEFSCKSLVQGKYPEVDRYGWAGFDELGSLAHETQQVNIPLLKKLVKNF